MRFSICPSRLYLSNQFHSPMTIWYWNHCILYVNPVKRMWVLSDRVVTSTQIFLCAHSLYLEPCHSQNHNGSGHITRTSASTTGNETLPKWLSCKWYQPPWLRTLLCSAELFSLWSSTYSEGENWLVAQRKEIEFSDCFTKTFSEILFWKSEFPSVASATTE